MSGDEAATLWRDPNFLVAMAVAVVVALGFGLVIPVLPLLAADLAAGAFAASLVVSVFAGVRLVSNVYAGGLADAIGARLAVGWGALVVAGSSLLVAIAPSYGWLLVSRGVGGLGSALFITALLALIVRIVPPAVRGRAVGTLQGSFLFGLVAGPAVGGALAEVLGLRGPFVVYAAACALAGLLAFVKLPRPPAQDPDDAAPSRPGLRQTLRTVRTLCEDRAFLAALVMQAATRWAAIGVRSSLVPLFGAQVLGASVGTVSLAVALASGTQLLGLWPAGAVSDRVGRTRLAAPGFTAYAVVVGVLGLVDSVPLFLVVMALYGLATGLTSVTPPAIVADVVPETETGVGIGVLNTAGDLGSVLGPIVAGLLADTVGYAWGFGSTAAVLAVAALAAALVRETAPGVAQPAG